MEEVQSSAEPATRDTSGLETVPGSVELGTSGAHESVGVAAPTHVGRYVIIDRVGAGGMGVVYAAYDPELDRKVAVKVLQPHRKAADAKSKMIREAQAMARLSHPNVVPVHDAGAHEEGVFIAMEFVAGGTLRDLQGREWREVLEAYRGAGLGLAAAHDAGLIHRDFKPDNVLLSKDGRPQVVDFGLARAAKGADTQSVLSTHNDELIVTGRHLSSDSAVTRSAGTPAYMAPEQFELRVPDARADQFSFCVALWEALYGARPWPAKGVGEQFAMMIEQPLPAVQARSPVPRWVADALIKGLNLDPEQRHGDMRALLGALDPKRATRWRRWLLAAAGLGAAAALVGGVQISQARACATAESTIDEVWNEARDEQGRAAFEASGVVGHAEAWALVRQRIETYAREWKELRRSACSGAAGRSQDPKDLARQVGCLDRRLVELDELLHALEHPDEVVVRKGVLATDSLGSLAACSDLARLRLARPWPTRDDEAALADEVWQHIQQSRALESLGKFEEGLVVAEDAVALSKRLDYAPLGIEARIFVGQHLGHLQRHDEALEQLQRAYFEALGHQSDELALRASIQLVDTTGVRMRDFDMGLLWAQTAQALGARHGFSRDLRARLLANRAGIHFRNAEFEEAEALVREAIALAEEDGNEVGGWSYQSNLGVVLRRLDRHEEALEVQRRILHESAALFGPDNPTMIGDYGNIGNTLSDLGRVKEAMVQQQKALSLAQKYYRGPHPKVAAALLNLGATASQAGDLHESARRNEQAVDMLVALHGKEDVKVQRALQNWAYVRFQLGDLEGALRLQEELLLRRQAQLDANHPELVRSFVSRASMQRASGEWARAIADCRTAIAALQEDRPTNDGELNWPYRELAWSLGMSGDLEGARDALAKAKLAAGSNTSRIAATLAVESELARSAGDAASAVGPATKAVELLRDEQPESTAFVAFAASRAHALWAAGSTEEARSVALGAIESAGGQGFSPSVDYRLHAIVALASSQDDARSHRDTCAALQPELTPFDRLQMEDLTSALAKD